MPTVTKPMTFERAYESAKRYVEEAAEPHQLYLLAVTRSAVQRLPNPSHLIPIINGAGGPPTVAQPVAQPREEVVEEDAIEQPETIAETLDKPARRKRMPKVAEPYCRNPYKEEPLNTELCAIHLGISRTRFYEILRDDPDLQRRASKGPWKGTRFTRYALDKWRKLSRGRHEHPLPGGMETNGRNLPPHERKNVTQPRCTTLNKDGSQCRGLTMRGYDVCALHAMFGTKSIVTTHDPKHPNLNSEAT